MDLKILGKRTPKTYISFKKLSFPTLNELAQNISKLTDTQKNKIILELRDKGIDINPEDIDSYIKALREKIIKHMDNKSKDLEEDSFYKKTLIKEFYSKTKRDGDNRDRLKENTLEEVLKSLNKLSNLSNFALGDLNNRLNQNLDPVINNIAPKLPNLSKDSLKIYMSELKTEVEKEVSRRQLIETPKIFYDDTVLEKLKSDLRKQNNKGNSNENITEIIKDYTHVGDTIVNNMLRGNYTFQEASKDSKKLSYSISPEIFYNRLEEIKKLIKHLNNSSESSTPLPKKVYRGFSHISKFMRIVGLNPSECLKSCNDAKKFNVGIFEGEKGTKLLNKALIKIENGGTKSLSKEEKKVLTSSIIDIIPDILADGFNVNDANIYSDQGFLSTSALIESAYEFIECSAGIRKNGVLLEINVPDNAGKGKHISKYSYFKSEAEVLFPPNTKIKLKKKIKYKYRILYIEADIV